MTVFAGKDFPYVKISGERFIVDLMYARNDNMTGRAIYREIGWGNLGVVHIDLWNRLKQLEKTLQQRKLKLKVCDAFRPRLAHEMMKKIIPMKGFFADYAEKSQHCLGTAVDVCLCDEEGRELRYPTKVDAYDAELSRQVVCGNTEAFKKHLEKARQDYYEDGIENEIKNRNFLRELMQDIGLEPISHEWWHYNLPDGTGENYPMIDLCRGDFL